MFHSWKPMTFQSTTMCHISSSHEEREDTEEKKDICNLAHHATLVFEMFRKKRFRRSGRTLDSSMNQWTCIKSDYQRVTGTKEKLRSQRENVSYKHACWCYEKELSKTHNHGDKLRPEESLPENKHSCFCILWFLLLVPYINPPTNSRIHVLQLLEWGFTCLTTQ
jgi:hypothetical protein